jgi:hypothetical protein
MNLLRFLADECFSHHILAAVRRAQPDLDILAVGEPGAPPKGTLDPPLLQAAIAMSRTLLSGDRSTMSKAVADHLRSEGHMPGAIFLRDGFPPARHASDIILIWACETTDEWLDRIDYIPY